jgi:hypothetical protein
VAEEHKAAVALPVAEKWAVEEVAAVKFLEEQQRDFKSCRTEEEL